MSGPEPVDTAACLSDTEIRDLRSWATEGDTGWRGSQEYMVRIVATIEAQQQRIEELTKWGQRIMAARINGIDNAAWNAVLDDFPALLEQESTE